MHEIKNDRVLNIYGDINESNIKELLNRIFEMHAKDNESWITLYICSFGGASQYAFSFFDLIKSVLKIKLQTVAFGTVQSAAAVLYLAGQHRVFCPTASIFLHCAGRKYDSPIFLSSYDFRVINACIKREEMVYAKIFESSTKGKLCHRRVLSLMRKERYIYAPQVLEMSLADEVLPSDIKLG